MSAALTRLQSGYYNSDQPSVANPGGLGGNGHQENFPKLLVDIGEVVGVDLTAMVALATTAADDAEDAAASALGAPGTKATSAATVLMATGTRVFGDVAGKLFSKNQQVVSTDNGNSANYMISRVVSYADPVLTVEVSEVHGPGAGTTKSSWELALTATGGVPITRKVLGAGLAAHSGTGALSGDVTITVTAASVAQIRAASSTSTVMTPKNWADSCVPQVLTYGATIPWDTDLGQNAYLLMQGDGTIDAPGGLFDGCPVAVLLEQDVIGGRRPNWHAIFDFPEGRPTPNPAAGKISRAYGTYWAITGKIDMTFRNAV